MLHTLYFSKFGNESSFDHGNNAVETYNATRLGKSRTFFVGREIDLYNDGRKFQNVYSMESGFGGKQELTRIGSFNHTEKKYSHTFGYFPQHKTGVKFKKLAEGLGYSIH
jgi:hypothetical protein